MVLYHSRLLGYPSGREIANRDLSRVAYHRGLLETPCRTDVYYFEYIGGAKSFAPALSALPCGGGGERCRALSAAMGERRLLPSLSIFIETGDLGRSAPFESPLSSLSHAPPRSCDFYVAEIEGGG